jgi:hypothetical protein
MASKINTHAQDTQAQINVLPFVDAWKDGTEAGKVDAGCEWVKDDVVGMAWNVGYGWVLEHAGNAGDKDRLALLTVYMNGYVTSFLSMRESNKA